MNEKFNKNAKVEKLTTMLGIAVRLIVIDPYTYGAVSVSNDWFLPLQNSILSITESFLIAESFSHR